MAKTDVSSPGEDMSLEQHLQMIGRNPRLFAFIANVPEEVVRRALDDQPIADAHAKNICKALSKEHGILGKSGYQPEYMWG